MAILGESYHQAFTSGLLDVYHRRGSGQEFGKNILTDIPQILGETARYVDLDSDGNWWIPSGRSFYHSDATTPEFELAHARKHFFVALRSVDPFGNASTVSYDDYDLLPTRMVDAAENMVSCYYDYRDLQPCLVVNPNGNRGQCAFDELGRVVATAVMGKEDEIIGDSLNDFRQITPEEIEQFFSDPQGPIKEALLGNASTRTIYDVSRFWLEPDITKKKPVFHATIARETHACDTLPGHLKTQISFSYSDGLGHIIQSKSQAGPKEGIATWITSG
jgi:hypothetical protein